MRRLDDATIRRCLLNATRSERASVALPRLPDLDWESTVVLGWRDPKSPLRGCLVWESGAQSEPTADPGAAPGVEAVQGVLLRAAESVMSARITAMCMLCRTVASADTISLFTARRTGAAGRNGNTVGTYICADLDCSGRVTGRTPVPAGQPDRTLPVQQRIAGLRERLERFVADVRR